MHAISARISGDLVVRLEVILRQRAGLAVHLDRAARTVVVECLDELGLGTAPQHPHVPGPVVEDILQLFGPGGRRIRAASAPRPPPHRRGHPALLPLPGRRCSSSTPGLRCSGTLTCGARACGARSLALGTSGQYLAHRDKGSEHTYRERSSIKHGKLPRCSRSLVVAVAEEELNALVAELEISDESRRIAVPRRKDRDLEELARLHRRLVDPLPGQRLAWRRWSAPTSLSSWSFVRDVELDVRVRIHKVQLLEPTLQHHLFIQVVHTRHGMMGLQSRRRPSGIPPVRPTEWPICSSLLLP